METFVIETIRKFLLKTKLASIFCIYKNNKDVYNNGIEINSSDISFLQNLITECESEDAIRNALYLNGLKINDNKFVVVLVEKMDGLYYIHSKAREEGLVTIIGEGYSLFIYYDDEYLPMLHDLKLEKIKKHIGFFHRLLI